MSVNMRKGGITPIKTIALAVSHPANPASGDPVRFGELTGVALTKKGQDIAGITTVDIGPTVFKVSVKGVDAGGNSAVAAGDKLYYTDADTPTINKKNTGRFFGTALGAVGSGATASIDVLVGR